MRTILIILLSSLSYPLFGQDTFQLAPPLLKYSSVFFTDATLLEIKFAQGGTAIHYTLNTTEPTITSKVYIKPVNIKNNFTTVKAKAFGSLFRPSETVTVTFIKDGKPIQSTEQTQPHSKYSGDGLKTLIDNKGGIENNRSTTWMGYNCDTVTITVHLAKPQKINKVLLNFLQNERSWIFLPEKININWFDKNSNRIKSFGTEEISAKKETLGSKCNYRIIQSQNTVQTNKILINILVRKNIPEWHEAKGEHAWMFIDEIKVY